MATLQIHYRLTKRHKYLINQKQKNDSYEFFKHKDIFVRFYESYSKLKIRTPKKYPFKRIKLFKKVKNNLWIGKIPNSEDLIIIEKRNNFDLHIIIHEGESKHLTLFATM